MQTVDNFLAHYGVKGMRWGHRKERSAVSVTTRTAPGRKVKASGGEHHMPSEDAIRTAALRRVAKKSTTDALSNRELQDVIQRMNLEAQFNNLNQNNVHAGVKIARVILGQAGDREVGQLQDFASDKRGRTTTDKNGNRVNDPTTSFVVKSAVAGAKTVVGGGKKK